LLAEKLNFIALQAAFNFISFDYGGLPKGKSAYGLTFKAVSMALVFMSFRHVPESQNQRNIA